MELIEMNRPSTNACDWCAKKIPNRNRVTIIYQNYMFKICSKQCEQKIKMAYAD